MKSDISKGYKEQVDCLKDSKSVSYDKIGMKEKVNDLVRLYKAMPEKFKKASYPEQIQILTLVPDKWYQMYRSEYFNVLEYLVWISHKIKRVGGILAKCSPKTGSAITTETFIW